MSSPSEVKVVKTYHNASVRRGIHLTFPLNGMMMSYLVAPPTTFHKTAEKGVLEDSPGSASDRNSLSVGDHNLHTRLSIMISSCNFGHSWVSQKEKTTEKIMYEAPFSINLFGS